MILWVLWIQEMPAWLIVLIWISWSHHCWFTWLEMKITILLVLVVVLSNQKSALIMAKPCINILYAGNLWTDRRRLATQSCVCEGWKDGDSGTTSSSTTTSEQPLQQKSLLQQSPQQDLQQTSTAISAAASSRRNFNGHKDVFVFDFVVYFLFFFCSFLLLCFVFDLL